MEGTMDSRLILQRPTSRPVPQRSNNLLTIDHSTPSSNASSSIAQPSAAPAVVSAAPTAAPVVAQPQFSQVTPIYAPTPVNTPADIAQPKAKSIEWVKSPSAPVAATVTPIAKPVVTPVAQPTSVPQVAPLKSALQPNIVINDVVMPMPPAAAPSALPAVEAAPIATQPAAMPTATPTAGFSANSSVEHLEKNLDSVDLDRMVGNVTEHQDVQPAVFAPVPAAAPVVIPAPTPVTAPQPVIAAAPVVAAAPAPAGDTSMFDHYFQNTEVAPSRVAGLKEKFSFSKLKNIGSPKIRKIAAIGALVAVIGIGGFVVSDSYFVNQKAKEVLASDTSQLVAVEPDMTETATDTTTTETTTTTDTTTPEDTAAAVQGASTTVPSTANSAVGYSVAPSLPRVLNINKLGIHAPVVSLGLTAAGAIDTPTNIWNAGWYNGSAKPGTDGATFIDGHSSADRGALMGKLDTLVAGDMIQVERGDGAKFNYKVTEVKIVDRHNVDMASMLRPANGAKSGLNIMTCVGQWIPAERTLTNRVLVYAVQV